MTHVRLIWIAKSGKGCVTAWTKKPVESSGGSWNIKKSDTQLACGTEDFRKMFGSEPPHVERGKCRQFRVVSSFDPVQRRDARELSLDEAVEAYMDSIAGMAEIKNLEMHYKSLMVDKKIRHKMAVDNVRKWIRTVLSKQEKENEK